MKRTAIAACAAAIAACAAPSFERVSSSNANPPAVIIDRVALKWSNVYLLERGDSIVLVDSGSPVDRDDLAHALAARNIDVHKIRAVVITHAHADHAGLARWLQQQGAAIVLGAADARLAARGSNDPLPATGLIAGWLAPLFMFAYEPFTPDVAVDGTAPPFGGAEGRGQAPAIDHELDLGAYGLPEVHVVPVPGHTPGSLAVLVGTEAIAGDLFKGGHLAKIAIDVPSEHFYQADPAADHRAVVALLDRGVTQFDIGHGGPVAAADVRAWVRDADDDSLPRVASIELAAHGERPPSGDDGDKGVTGVLRARFGIGGALAYYGGVDVRAGSVDGERLEVDLHALGGIWRAHGGAFVAVTYGVGFGGIRGLGATHVPAELSTELPLGPVRLLARGALGWRLSGAAYAADRAVDGRFDEATALVGVRLGRDRAWGKVVAGAGPYLAVTYRDLGGEKLEGIELGFDLFAGD